MSSMAVIASIIWGGGGGGGEVEVVISLGMCDCSLLSGADTSQKTVMSVFGKQIMTSWNGDDLCITGPLGP